MYDENSSPDPLNDNSSISLAKPPNLSRLTHNTPSRISSNKRQTFQLDVGNEISPQKIRVTVEASDNCSNDESDVPCSLRSTPSRPKRNIKGNQKSDKIPFFHSQEDSAVTPRKGRGRPKKTTSAASIKKTLINNNLRSKNIAKGSINVDDGRNYEYQNKAYPEETLKKTKERARSRSRKPKDTPQNRSSAKLSDTGTSKTSEKTAKKASDLLNISSQPIALHDTSHSLSVVDNDLDLKRIDQNKVKSKSYYQTSASIRPDVNGELYPFQKRLSSENDVTKVIENSNLHHGNFSCDKNKPFSKYYPSPASPEKLLGRDIKKMPRIALENQPEEGFDSNNDCEDQKEFMKNSLIEEYRESDTILESEEFSMISVESLPSMKEYLGSSFCDGTNLRNEDTSLPDNIRENPSTVKPAISNYQYHDPDNYLHKNAPQSSDVENNHNSNACDNEKGSKGRSSWSNKNDEFPELTSDSTRPQRHAPITESEEFDDHTNLDPYPPAKFGDTDNPATGQDEKYSHAPNNLSLYCPISNPGPDLSSSRIRLLTPKKTSSPTTGEMNDWESPSPVCGAPVMKSSGDQLESHLTKSYMPLPPAPSSHCNSKTHHLEQEISHNSSSIVSSPSSPLPTYEQRSTLSSSSVPRNSHDDILSESSYIISQDLISDPSPQLNGKKFGRHLMKESIESELKVEHNESSSHLPQKQREVQSQIIDHCYNNSQISRPSIQPHTYDDNQEQFNICSNSEDIKFADASDNCTSQNEDAMSWHYEEPKSISKKGLGTKFNESSDNPDEEEEYDFDLLLETINSASPVVLKLDSSPEEMVEKSRSPAICPNRRKNIVSDIETFGSASSNTYERNKQAKKFKITTLASPMRVNSQNENDDITSSNIDYSKNQISQKMKFKPTKNKTPDLDPPTFFKASPVNEPPKKHVFSRNSSTKANNTCHSPYIHNLESADTDISSASDTRRLFTPIPQKAQFSPRTKSDSLSLKRIDLNTSQRSSRGLSPISFNPEPNVIEKHLHPGNHILSSSLCKTNPISLSRTINTEESNISLKNQKIQFNQSFDPSIRMANSSKEGISQKVIPNTPTKSCLRSPLKSSSKYPPILGSPVRAVTFVSSSPPPLSPFYHSLSPTTWTRNHWLTLNDIVQRWKAQKHSTSSFSCRSENTSPVKQQNITNSGSKEGNYCRRNSTRVISQLLGKYVFNAEGDRLKLEQWHLEAVDEFRGIAPGWEEKSVAMRLFALLVGERIRAQRNT